MLWPPTFLRRTRVEEQHPMPLLGRTEHRFLGSEFDWLAMDRVGNLGYFSTAGAGWIPESVLSEPEPFWDTLGYIKSLPIVSDAFRNGHIAPVGDEWVEVARRGIFALDWSYSTERYALAAAPLKPIALNQVESAIVADLFNRTNLDCDFDSQLNFPEQRD